MFATAALLALHAEQKRAPFRNGNSLQSVALRCRLLLLAHQGTTNHSIAQ